MLNQETSVVPRLELELEKIQELDIWNGKAGWMSPRTFPQDISKPSDVSEFANPSPIKSRKTT